MIAEPLSETGAVHDTETDRSPATPETSVGAPGTVKGVTGAEAFDATPGPAALIATNVTI